MKFEPAATDASQTRNLQAGVEMESGSLSRLVPFAAVVEVTSWMASDFEMDIKSYESTTD